MVANLRFAQTGDGPSHLPRLQRAAKQQRFLRGMRWADVIGFDGHPELCFLVVLATAARPPPRPYQGEARGRVGPLLSINLEGTMVHATNEEISKILATIDRRDPMGERDYNAILIMQHTGLRVSELCGLDIYDVFDGKEVRTNLYVRPEIAKGGAEGAGDVPLNSTARQAISNQLSFQKRRGFRVDLQAPLFTTKRHNRLMSRALEYVLAELRERARLAKPVTPHSMRHNLATTLSGVANLRVCQKVMRLKRLNTVAIYTEVLPDEMTAALDRIG
jgi:integrase